MRLFDIRRRDGYRRAKVADSLPDLAKLATMVGSGLSRPERAPGVQPLVRVRREYPQIGDRGQGDRGHAGLLGFPESVRDIRAAERADKRVRVVQAGQETASWVGVHIDPRSRRWHDCHYRDPPGVPGISAEPAERSGA